MARAQSWWSKVWIPAAACLLAGFAMTFLRIPAAWLASAVGNAAFLLLPLVLFGAALGGALVAARNDEDAHVVHGAMGGFAVGAVLAGLLFNPLDPGFAGYAVAGLTGGVGLSIGLGCSAASGTVISGTSALGFGGGMCLTGPIVICRSGCSGGAVGALAETVFENVLSFLPLAAFGALVFVALQVSESTFERD